MARQLPLESATGLSDREAHPGQGGNSAGSAMPLLLRLQTTLDLEQLLEMVAEELERVVSTTGMVFRDAEGEIVHRLGRAGRHRAAYRLRIEGEVLGEVTLHRSRAFSEQQLARVEQILGLVQFPLRNAIHHAEAQRLARCDGLTGLYNRTALHEVLHREVTLAHRHGEDLALIVLDLDNFKGINDTLGHPAGDAILREFADILRGCSRRSDLLFRYAGDEFVVGSSHTDIDGGRVIAQRILDTVAATHFRHGDVELPTPGVSIGIAALNPDESADGLFERADRALYQAKAGGRNRIECDSTAASA